MSLDNEHKNVEKRSHTKSVMVWAGISGKGETDIVFVPECTKISANSYHKFNLSKHVSQINKTFVKGNSWIFQQDEARAHSAKLTQEWLSKIVQEFIYKNEWPPSSPDLNPCDFYLWGRRKSLTSENTMQFQH